MNQSGDWRIRALNAVIAPFLNLYPALRQTGVRRVSADPLSLWTDRMGVQTATRPDGRAVRSVILWIRLSPTVTEEACGGMRYRAVFELASLCVTEGTHGARDSGRARLSPEQDPYRALGSRCRTHSIRAGDENSQAS